MAALHWGVPIRATAQQLIQCPDWRSLVSPAVLRSASDQAKPGAFDAKLQQARAAGSRNVSPPSNGLPGGDDGRRRVTVAACTYTVQPGDTYGSIAARTLGTSRRWPELTRANPGIDPNRLRVGAVINLPCAGRAGQGEPAPKAKPGAPLAGTGFLARLYGQKAPAAASAGKTAGAAATVPEKKDSISGKKKSPAAKPGASKAPEKAKPQTAAPAKPPAPPPLPIWTAKAGEDFAVVLQRWARAAKYRVVVGTTDAWTISVPLRLQVDFETAVNQLVRGLGSDGKAPPVRIYSNRVVRLGGL